jgi:hypothetical protein
MVVLSWLMLAIGFVAVIAGMCKADPWGRRWMVGGWWTVAIAAGIQSYASGEKGFPVVVAFMLGLSILAIGFLRWSEK